MCVGAEEEDASAQAGDFSISLVNAGYEPRSLVNGLAWAGLPEGRWRDLLSDRVYESEGDQLSVEVGARGLGADGGAHDGLGGAELLRSGAGLEGEGPGGGGCGDGSELGSVERRRSGYRCYYRVRANFDGGAFASPRGTDARLGSNGGSGRVRTGHADGESGHDVCL